MFLSHLKTRYGYDFPLYFRHEFFMNFLSNVSYTRSVSSVIQTPRSELKNEAIAEFF